MSSPESEVLATGCRYLAAAIHGGSDERNRACDKISEGSCLKRRGTAVGHLAKAF